jgi:nucleotide-binding universal stress UspA family protein
MNAPGHAVVVGVSEDGVDAALSFAASEARRTERPLHLVHVAQLPATTSYAGIRRDILEAGTAALERAEMQAAKLAGAAVPVTTEVLDNGAVAEGLAHHTSGASMLVLQHRALGRVSRLVGGSIAQSVAGRAVVPVISVPENWKPRRDGVPVVTVAVQDLVEAPALLHTAFLEARARHAAVVVLHAWWLASGFDEDVVDVACRDQYATEMREELDPILAPLRGEFPDVEFAVTVQHQPPVEAVLDAAEKSDLLLLGRRHHLLPFASHLGPIARAAIGHATCPVLIHPEISVAVTEIPYSERLAAIGRPAETS